MSKPKPRSIDPADPLARLVTDRTRREVPEPERLAGELAVTVSRAVRVVRDARSPEEFFDAAEELRRIARLVHSVGKGLLPRGPRSRVVSSREITEHPTTSFAPEDYLKTSELPEDSHDDRS